MTGALRMLRRAALLASLWSALAIVPAMAQTSPSFKLTEATINAGGDPGSGGRPASPHFHLSLDAVGDDLVRAGLASASFHLDGGFVGRYPPPGEVHGLLLNASATLQWSAEPSAAEYETYRGLISTLPGSYGDCFAGGLTAVTAADASIPPSGEGYFYLVTARNRLGEEGPKGYRSDGTEDGNPSPCP
jgi:hypothetical protein